MEDIKRYSQFHIGENTRHSYVKKTEELITEKKSIEEARKYLYYHTY